MKKTRFISLVLVLLISASLLAGCAGGGKFAANDMASSESTGSTGGFMGSTGSSAGGMSPGASASKPVTDGAYDKFSPESLMSSAGATTGTQQVSDYVEKIIYTADASIETVSFDETVGDVYKMIDSYGGFIEDSYISGTNYRDKYYGYQTYRDARFTIRVPVSCFADVTDSLYEIGNVTYISTKADNISTEFYDTESRLKTYRTEEERLLAMLEAAKTVEEMIAIEERLSNVRYNIESLETTLRNWQNKIDYSTITLTVIEVEEYTEVVTAPPRSYWQQVADGFMSSLKDVGRFFTRTFKNFVVSLPQLVASLVLIGIAVLIIVKIIKSGVKKHSSRSAEERGERKLPKFRRLSGRKKNDSDIEE